MLRGLILLLLAIGVAIVAMPFVMTSRALDEHGIPLSGAVYHKSEYVKVVYSNWELSREVTLSYTVPETQSMTFFAVHPSPEQYDTLHTGQKVEIRYLPRKDVPDLPGSKILWELHALPTARLANIQGVSRLDAFLTPNVVLGGQILAAIIGLLICWRITRRRAFGWAAALAAVPLIAFIILEGFPRPTPAPEGEVRLATGRVAQVERIDKLFSGSRSRGVIADQPIDVVSVEFVPEGKTEPVIAVDLIDRGSIPGLKEKSAVTVKYEQATPRTAHLQGATRQFPQKNASGTLVTGVLCLITAIVLLGVAFLFGKFYRRLVSR